MMKKNWLKNFGHSVFFHALLAGVVLLVLKGDAPKRLTRSLMIEVSSANGDALKKPVPRRLVHKSSPLEEAASENPITDADESEVAAEGNSDAPSQSGAVPNANQTASYAEELRARIDELKLYPAIAKSRHQTGRVEVGFTLRKGDGAILNAHVVKSSEYDRLNEAALQTVTKLSKFKPVPDELSKTDWDVIVPIDFRLAYQ
jgi:protein TonB